MAEHREVFKHRVRVIVVNGLHLWECEECGLHWNAEWNYHWIERQPCLPGPKYLSATG